MEAPPPSQESGGRKVLSGLSRPASPAARPAPSPPVAQAGAAPPPARRPLSRLPGHAPCLLEPLPESRLPPFPTHLPGRLRRSPLTPPAATVHTNRLRSRTHSPSLTHSATTAPERPTYYASLACYVPRARARARVPQFGARFASKRREENASASGRIATSAGAAWEMKFRFQGRGQPVLIGA